VNEISGGFEAVSEDKTEFDLYDFLLQDNEFEKYGYDFDEESLKIVEVTSEGKVIDSQAFRCDLCNCSFGTLLELNAHEVGHEFENFYKCPVINCNNKYHKAKML